MDQDHLDENDLHREGKLPHDPFDGTEPAEGGGTGGEQGPPQETVPAEPKVTEDLPVIRFKPFPVRALPKKIRDFVLAGAKSKCVDPCFYAVPSLSVLTAAVGMRRRLRVKDSWIIAPIAWTCLIAESGSIKTEPFNQAVRPLRQQDVENSRQYQAEMAEHLDKLDDYDKELRKWKADKKGEVERVERPTTPIEKVMTIEDITREEVARKLAENPGGLLLTMDEMQGWIDSWGAYKQGRGGDGAFWRKCFDGGLGAVDRVKDRKKGRILVPHMAVSIAGTIQPGALQRRLIPELFEDGTVARVLFANPPELEYEWTDEDIPDSVTKALADLYQDLMALSFDDDTPVDIPLTKAAKDLFVEFVEDNVKRGKEEGGNIRAALAKLRGYAGVFALAIQCCYDIDRGPEGPEAVDAPALLKAIEIVDFFENEMRRVYSMIAEDPLEREDRKVMEVIERLQAKGPVYPSDIARHYRPIKGEGGAEKAKEICDRLVGRGKAKWGPSQRKGRYSRPILLLPEAGPSGDGRAVG